MLAGKVPKRQQRFVEAWIELHQYELLQNWRYLQNGLPPDRIAPLTKGPHMLHAIYRVTNFEAVAPYTLRVQFNDGVEQTIDFQPIMAGKLFAPLRDLALFNQVKLDPEVHTLVWPNGADFDPATLHDWHDHVEELTSRAKQWAASQFKEAQTTSD